MVTITVEDIIAGLALFTAACVAGGWLIKIIKGVMKPKTEMDGKIKGNKDKIDEHEDKFKKIDDTLDYLVNANNLVIRSLFTVLGELSDNNDKHGNIAKAQKEIHEFLTPVK